MALKRTIRPGDGPAFNALKHGGYATSVLLPGDDLAEFRRERRALFHNYRPQTKDEADLVEAIAEHHWTILRFRAVQAFFDGQAVAPELDGAGRIVEPIAHQRLHSGMDVTVHRGRIERLWHRARAKLIELQKLRRQGLVAGAIALPRDCYMETDGRVLGPVVLPTITPIPEPDIEADGTGVPASHDGRNGKNQEQQERDPLVSLPRAVPATEPGGVGADRDPPLPLVQAGVRRVAQKPSAVGR